MWNLAENYGANAMIHKRNTVRPYKRSIAMEITGVDTEIQRGNTAGILSATLKTA